MYSFLWVDVLIVLLGLASSDLPGMSEEPLLVLGDGGLSAFASGAGAALRAGVAIAFGGAGRRVSAGSSATVFKESGAASGMLGAAGIAGSAFACKVSAHGERAFLGTASSPSFRVTMAFTRFRR